MPFYYYSRIFISKYVKKLSDVGFWKWEHIEKKNYENFPTKYDFFSWLNKCKENEYKKIYVA